MSVLDAKTLKTVAKIDLPNGSINAQEIKVSPDGRYAYLTHVVARFNVPTTQVERGWINTNAVSLVDTASDKLYATFLLDDIELGAANPYGLAFTPDGSKLLVAHAGTHEVGIIDRPALERRLAEKSPPIRTAKRFSRTSATTCPFCRTYAKGSRCPVAARGT